MTPDTDQRFPLSEDYLATLAPQRLTNYRTLRYRGEGMSLALDEFVEPDRTTMTRLYALLTSIYDLLRDDWHNPQKVAVPLQTIVQEANWTRFIGELQHLGRATREHLNSPTLAQILHDIRGGSFMALSLYLQLLEMSLVSDDDFARVFFLARDHLKIMRNAIRDIDPPRQTVDATLNMHSVHLLLEKWDGVTYRLPDNTAQIYVDCHFHGSVSESCLEFSALDRVLYNLINNAVRYTNGDAVYVAILPVPSDEATDLRFIVYNPISDTQQTRLAQKFGDSLSELFRGGFTTDGHGLGMRICADFVVNAYGLRGIDTALAEGYFGATINSDMFINWVHWPLTDE